MSCDYYCRGTSTPCFVFPEWVEPETDDPEDDA